MKNLFNRWVILGVKSFVSVLIITVTTTALATFLFEKHMYLFYILSVIIAILVYVLLFGKSELFFSRDVFIKFGGVDPYKQKISLRDGLILIIGIPLVVSVLYYFIILKS